MSKFCYELAKLERCVPLWPHNHCSPCLINIVIQSRELSLSLKSSWTFTAKSSKPAPYVCVFAARNIPRSFKRPRDVVEFVLSGSTEIHPLRSVWRFGKTGM